HGVIWFSRLFIDHVYPEPSSETWKPNDSFAMTLIQGAGVHCPSPRMVTYSRPSDAKPPRPLKNSSSGRGGGTSARGLAAATRGGGRGVLGARISRTTCSARLP